MKTAAYSAAMAESTIVATMTDRFKIEALGRVPCIFVPIHMYVPARDLAFVSDRYDALEWTLSTISDAWMNNSVQHTERISLCLAEW